MRRSLILLFTAGLLGMGVGCSRTLQHTAGVWDCDPPAVESVLKPYSGISPATPAVTPTTAVPMAPQTVTPQTNEPQK